MATVAFDTLILSRKLAATGMPVDQAQGVAAAIAETLGEQIATRRDIDDVKRDIGDVKRDIAEARAASKRDVEELRREVTAQIDRVEAKLSARIDQVETKVAAQFDLLRAEARQSEQRMTIRLGLMLAGGLALVATLVKLL